MPADPRYSLGVQSWFTTITPTEISALLQVYKSLCKSKARKHIETRCADECKADDNDADRDSDAAAGL